MLLLASKLVRGLLNVSGSKLLKGRCLIGWLGLIAMALLLAKTVAASTQQMQGPQHQG